MGVRGHRRPANWVRGTRSRATLARRRGRPLALKTLKYCRGLRTARLLRCPPPPTLPCSRRAGCFFKLGFHPSPKESRASGPRAAAQLAVRLPGRGGRRPGVGSRADARPTALWAVTAASRACPCFARGPLTSPSRCPPMPRCAVLSDAHVPFFCTRSVQSQATAAAGAAEAPCRRPVRCRPGRCCPLLRRLFSCVQMVSAQAHARGSSRAHLVRPCGEGGGGGERGATRACGKCAACQAKRLHSPDVQPDQSLKPPAICTCHPPMRCDAMRCESGGVLALHDVSLLIS